MRRSRRRRLTGRLSAPLAEVTRPRTVHGPGRVLVDLAVAVADGAECISDIAVLADQPGLFGAVASDSTVVRPPGGTARSTEAADHTRDRANARASSREG
jgi:hypothetical protein